MTTSDELYQVVDQAEAELEELRNRKKSALDNGDLSTARELEFSISDARANLIAAQDAWFPAWQREIRELLGG